MRAFGYFMATVLTLVLGMLWSGYVLSILWAWFMVPAFGLPAISIPLALGIALIIGFITKDVDWESQNKKPYSEILVRSIGVSFFKPLFALIFGWVVRFFV